MLPTNPDSVTLIEVGPRDGFQFERKQLPTEFKRHILAELSAAGLRHIQATSFVHPRKVPQMADAEEVIAGLPQGAGTDFSALVLNVRGIERAYHAGLGSVEVSVSASDSHSRRNTGMSTDQAITVGRDMILKSRAFGMSVRAGIQCAFGCVDEGQIPISKIIGMLQIFIDAGAHWMALADTTGMATPRSVQQILEKIQAIILDRPLALHFHDTRGLGLANVMTALDHGVRHFDTALGGMGGCPFVQGAAGNIATEDTVYLLESLGFDTGIDNVRVARCSLELETFFGKQFSGKMHRILGG